MMSTHPIYGAEQIRALIRSSLVELSGLDPFRMAPAARPADDVGVGSIDAVDRVDHVKKATGRRICAEDSRSARTVPDLARAIERLSGA
jgi:acyl carrier protein